MGRRECAVFLRAAKVQPELLMANCGESSNMPEVDSSGTIQFKEFMDHHNRAQLTCFTFPPVQHLALAMPNWLDGEINVMLWGNPD